MSAFTAGPWRIAGKGTIRAGKDHWIADICWRNRDANARLIAAAPAMAEALLYVAERILAQHVLNEFEAEGLAKARAALAAAGIAPEGATP